MRCFVVKLIKKVIRNVGLILFASTIFVAYFYFVKHVTSSMDTEWAVRGQFGDMFGALNTVFSCLAIGGVIYTINRQRKDAYLRIKPLLDIEPLLIQDGYKLLVKNIGYGAAINIEFEPLPLHHDFPLVYKSNRIGSLGVGETKVLEVLDYVENELVDKMMNAHLDPQYANRELKINIVFEDLEFKKITQEFKLGLREMKMTMTKYK